MKTTNKIETTSCTFLQKAIFLGTDEFRHCCYRFYVDGEMKGDVAVFPVETDRDASLDKVVAEKKNLIEKINNGEKTECFGCPLLQRKDWMSINDEKFNLISIESHSRCNMRCEYCSDTYYGGKEPNYDPLEFIKQFYDHDRIADDLQVSWGGGEPTVMRGFEKTVDYVTSHIKPKTQRFFSNSINYSEEIVHLLKENKASLTTSIDAGTPETFKKVRGVNQFEKVLTNIKRYFDASPENVVMQYIFSTEENSSWEEIRLFTKQILLRGLEKGNFLLSCNFKSEMMTKEIGFKILYTQYLLIKQGAKTCVLNEHVRPRISKITHEIIKGDVPDDYPDEILPVIKSIQDFKGRISNIIIWGASDYAKFVLDKSETYSDSEVLFFVDSNPKKQGILFLDKEVKSPEAVLTSDAPILVAASFWYHEIMDQLVELGVDEKRVLPNYLI